MRIQAALWFVIWNNIMVCFHESKKSDVSELCVLFAQDLQRIGISQLTSAFNISKRLVDEFG